MGKRFEKKITDKSVIEAEEKKVGLGKKLTGAGVLILGFGAGIIKFLTSWGNSDGSNKS